MKVGPANSCAAESASVSGLGFLSHRSAEGARLADLLPPFELPLAGARPTRWPLSSDSKQRSILSLTQLSLEDARPGFLPQSRRSLEDADCTGETDVGTMQLVGGGVGSNPTMRSFGGVGNSGGRAAAAVPAMGANCQAARERKRRREKNANGNLKRTMDSKREIARVMRKTYPKSSQTRAAGKKALGLANACCEITPTIYIEGTV